MLKGRWLRAGAAGHVVRVLKPPGGGSSCIFGSPTEAPAPTRRHKIVSNIFGSPPEPQNVPQRSNPPGGKTSGIFADSAAAPVVQRANQPPAGKRNIFSEEVLASPKAHPNKPKVTVGFLLPAHCIVPFTADDALSTSSRFPLGSPKEVRPSGPDPALAAHEPHLGPRPRSHNRVLNPPGGKSSVTFY
uniref:Jupiter microtubule associated homolog 2 n=1 Tax=Leptobrachium leishanense TaxID=445787 RepID=A0A8C5R230_9ANUR